MTDFALLDVAIGVIFAILAFSLIASALQEALASALNWRGRMLRRGLIRLLEGATEYGPKLVSVTWLTEERVEDAQLTLKFLENPRIRALYGPKSLLDRLWAWMTTARSGEGSAGAKIKARVAKLGRMPSAIPKETFARALIDMLMADVKVAYSEIDVSDGVSRGEVQKGILETRQLLGAWAKDADAVIDRARGAVEMLPMDDQLKTRLLRTLREISLSQALEGKLDTLDGAAREIRAEIEARIDRAQAMIDETVLAIGDWFDATMDRVTGWYVRRAKWVLFLLGFLMAAVVNFDVIGYGDQLLNDEGLRRRIVAQAEAAAAAEAVGELAVARTGRKQIAALALNTERDGTITLQELEAGLSPSPERVAAGAKPLPADLRLALGLAADPAAAPTEEQKQQVLALLNDTLAGMPGAFPVDSNNDGIISPEEEAAAVEEYLANMRTQVGISLGALQSQFADQGVEFGWSCPEGGLSFGCAWEQFSSQSLLSWLLIGLGCTLGGQFWFDLLRQVIKVKTAASGLNSDLKKLSDTRRGQAQGSA